MDSIKINGLRDSLKAAMNNLSRNKSTVNNLNVFPVPDGDTGTNMLMTIKSAYKVAMESETPEDIKTLMKNFSKGSLLGARGNSGVILSQLIRGFAEAIPDKVTELTIPDIVKCSEKAATIAYNAVMKPTEGTILTVAKDISIAAKKYPRKEKDVLKFYEYILVEAHKSLKRTPDLLPVLKEAGVVDAGGSGLIYLLEGAYMYLSGDTSILTSDDIVETAQSTIEHDHAAHASGDIKFSYCTEFILSVMADTKVDVEKELKNNFNKAGDSLIVVGEDDIFKVHVHTNNPGLVLEKALEFGTLQDIKIDNMKLQHSERMFTAEEYGNSKNEVKPASNEHFKNAFIAVSAGKGFDEIFSSLNVAKIISGGQTMNPSTEDILSAIDELNADNIFILPNNSNIILAAEQARTISNKNIYVVPTNNMPQGIVAVLSLMEENSPEENFDAIMESINSLVSGEVTYAVRNTTINGTEIKEGEIIGLAAKNILANGNDAVEVCFELINNLYDEDKSLLAIYYGEDTKDDDVTRLTELVEERYPELGIDAVYGGQPLYYFIISLE